VSRRLFRIDACRCYLHYVATHQKRRVPVVGEQIESTAEGRRAAGRGHWRALGPRRLEEIPEFSRREVVIQEQEYSQGNCADCNHHHREANN
jgi:hypothetical protein